MHKYLPVISSDAGNLVKAFKKKIVERGFLRTVYYSFGWLLNNIWARLLMAILSPDSWPLSVDKYLLRSEGDFRRTYFYPGCFRNKINTFAVFGYLMNKTKDLAGDIGEFGVYKGGSLVRWAKNIKLMSLNKKVYGFDSFEGYPGTAAVDLVGEKQNIGGELADTSEKSVRRYCRRLGVNDSVILVKGFYPGALRVMSICVLARC